MVHKPGICTMSLGRCFAGHSLAHKLDMAQKYGFVGVEIFYEDLEDFAVTITGGSSPTDQLSAARETRNLCEARGLEIICLQPLMHYGGLVDRAEHQQRFKEAHFWIQLAHCLGTDLIVLPSSFLPPERITNNIDYFVRDMMEVADLGLQQTPTIRFAHEALCWGTRIDTWQGSWEVVKKVNRPNFGICLDTFNVAGRVYADPASGTGRTLNPEHAIRSSMEALLHVVDLKKLFLLQVADAERLSAPLDSIHPFYKGDQPARMTWSRNCRLFYGESQHGAYLPIRNILSMIVSGMGYDGWVSFEVFNRRLAEEDRNIPEEMAKRASLSWSKMVKEVPLQTEGSSSMTSSML